MPHASRTPEEQAWTFRTVGHGTGTGTGFWAPFIGAPAEVGYDDVVSVENEDPVRDAVEGVADAARFIKPLLH
ncbi:hypothetical protein AB0D74_43800 [Streptomyces sp. NPDC048278]|uniref:hypothetical protein n=1 Tax=Streptomyces sp. NPDC048278 TaxID=3155809 RepID=UPI0034221B80